MRQGPRFLVLPAVLSLLAACISQPVRLEDHLDAYNNRRIDAPPPGKGVIYVIRKPRFNQMVSNFHVFLDGKKTGYLANRAYLNFAVDPGEH